MMFQIVTLAIILLVLSVLTQTFYYIPNAALSGVIWLALTQLLDFTVLFTYYSIISAYPVTSFQTMLYLPF